MRQISRILLLCVGFLVHSAYANDRFADVEVTAQLVSGQVYVLYGAGGNIGVLTGKDGALLVDAQFEPLAAKIEKALSSLSSGDNKVKYVVNTHYHGDHTGGNSYFSKSASVLAHENVRKRLAVKSKLGLPVISYKDGVALHINQETVKVNHVGKAHTDGDSVIHFKQANVWHLGDLFFADRFPFVDINSGGTVLGLIQVLEKLLVTIEDGSSIIPGHGQVTDKKGLTSYLDMIKTTQKYVLSLKKQGMSESELITKGLDKKWQDWSWSFINEERWIKTLYQEK